MQQIARSRLLQSTSFIRSPQASGSVRCIASQAEALSYHPQSAASQATLSTTIGAATESQTAKAERTLRRFWKEVSLATDKSDDSWSVLLDKRTLKTPSGKKLTLPREKLAAATVIAHEWDCQEQLLKPFSLPLTSLASRALDGLDDPSIRSEVITVLARYLHTDTVCFMESGKSQALTKLQAEHWTPLIEWVEKTFDVKIQIAEGQLFNRQSEETVEALKKAVAKYDMFRLASFERAVMASKSFIIALGLTEGRLSADAAALAAHVEVQSQIDRWGEVEDTHDVDHQDVRVRLGSAALLMSPLPKASSNSQ